MKNLIYILFVLVVGCSGSKDIHHKYYLNVPSGQVYSLIDLVVKQNGNWRINFNKVKTVIIDMDQFWYKRLTEKGFQVLSKCHALEYVSIIYPKGYLENDFSIELSEAFSGMKNLTQLKIEIDSADHIPDLIYGSNGLQKISIKGNFIKELSINSSSESLLKVLNINCSTNRFSLSGKGYSELISLNLNINGKIEELDFSGLKELENLRLESNDKMEELDFSDLKNLARLSLDMNGQIEKIDFSDLIKLQYLSFRNDQIEYLPNDFFEFPNLQKLNIFVPKLKKLNESISNLNSLESLSFTSYDIIELPKSLSKLEHLRQFSINTIGQVVPLKPLTTLPKLERLSISGFNLLEVVDEVLLMTELKVLHFTLRPLINQDLSPLNQLEKLKKIQYTTIYVERDGDYYIRKDLSDSTQNEILNQLKQVLPEHF